MADTLDTEYMQFRRGSAGSQAWSRLLSKNGLDENAQPIPAQTEGIPVQMAPTSSGASGQWNTSGTEGEWQKPSPGLVTEAGRAIVGGATDAVRNMIDTAGELAGYIEEKTGIPKGGAGAEAIKNLLPQIQENESTIGGMARGTTQFITGYLTGGRVLGPIAAGAKVGPLIAGAFSDITSFDPNSPDLSNLLQQLNPNLKNNILTFLATDPKDSAAENRFKRAIEGMGLGMATNLIFGIVKNWRAARNVKAVENAVEQARTGSIPPKPVVGKVPFEPGPSTTLQTAEEIADNAAREAKANALLTGGNPTLAAAQYSQTVDETVRANPTLKVAQETLLKGQSEEAMTKELLKDKGTLSAILKDQGAEASPGAIYALARGAVGAAIGFTQGDTMEDRITNALVLGGIAAAVKPSYIKNIIDTLTNKFPRETKVIKSFEAPSPPTLKTSKRGIPTDRRLPMKPVEVATETQAADFLKANPDAIEVGKKAIKINWDEIDSLGKVDDTIKVLTDLNKESIDVARRGVQTEEKRRMLANMLGMTEEDMLRRRTGQALNSEQTQAFIDLYGSGSKELDRLALAVKAGEPVELQFRAHLGKMTALTNEIFGARAEAGRSLRVWGEAAGDINKAKQLKSVQIANKAAGDVPTERLADMVLSLNTTAQKATALRQISTLGKSALLEAYINGLLSNPVTHVRNAISNTAMIANGIIERQIAGTIGKEVAFGEAGAMVHGLAGGWLDSFRLARRAFATGRTQLGFGKIDIPLGEAISAENFGVSGQIGRGVDLLGQFIRTPGRLLLAADDFYKGINYRMELHRAAFSQAVKEGNTGTAWSPNMAKRMNELLHDDDFLSLAKDAAESFANYQTFNQPLGELGSGYLHWLDQHPLARLVTPFVRTPTNIAKYTWERTPVLNLLSNKFRQDLFHSGPGVARDMALAKLAYGGMIFGSAVYLASAGYFTGKGPRNTKVMDLQRSTTGWQPDSMLIGDKYISISGIDPNSSWIGLAARFAETMSEASDWTIGNIAASMTMAFADTFIHKTYAQGILDVFEAIQAPDKQWQHYYEKRVASLVPSGVAQIARTMDPILREVNSAWDRVQSRWPGQTSNLEPRLNIWGDEIQLEGGVGPDLVSPFYISTKKDDPVSDEMVRLEIGVGMPNKWIFGTRPRSSPFAKENVGEGIQLSPQQYTKFVQLSAGHGLRGTSQTLHDKLEREINSPIYQHQSDLVKVWAVERIISHYRQAAERQLIVEDPELRDLRKESIQTRVEARRPTGAGNLLMK